MKFILLVTLCGGGFWAGTETVGQEYTILTLHAAVVLGIGTALVRSSNKNTDTLVNVGKVMQSLQDEIKELRSDVKELRQQKSA